VFLVPTSSIVLLPALSKFLFPIQEVEKDVKARTKGELGAAKTLCTPFEQPELPEGMVL
jgi:hypothetical protein